ncbi:MAG TPA: hypothetical protein VGJ95_08145, partial [Pseudonocardiaceae bacterium]
TGTIISPGPVCCGGYHRWQIQWSDDQSIRWSAEGDPATGERWLYRTGDCNGDGHIDYLDYASFPGCMSGPSASPGAECDCHDIDVDEHVSLRDFAGLQRNYTGPSGQLNIIGPTTININLQLIDAPAVSSVTQVQYANSSPGAPPVTISVKSIRSIPLLSVNPNNSLVIAHQLAAVPSEITPLTDTGSQLLPRCWLQDVVPMPPLNFFTSFTDCTSTTITLAPGGTGYLAVTVYRKCAVICNNNPDVIKVGVVNDDSPQLNKNIILNYSPGNCFNCCP